MSSVEDVSVIIPVHCNTDEALEWLDECIKSAVNQGDCQVVCIDDGSTKDITPIASKYNIEWRIRHSNYGVSYTRNQAAELANRELLLPLDCDDLLVEGAIGKLVSIWDGTVPVYPDVSMFGMKTDEHYRLLDFDCEHLLNHVGFTSVNVLHAKWQWLQIHGWDPNIEFYEDGEYNARLLGTFCGLHYPEPLVAYRQHPSQRTQTFKKSAGSYATELMTKIRSYKMACSGCGGKKKVNTAVKQEDYGFRSPAVPVLIGDAPVNLPLTFEGNLLNQYLGGKGRAKHYYEGAGTKFPYYVEYGDWIYAKPADSDTGYFKAAQQIAPAVMAAPVSQPVLVIENNEAPAPAPTTRKPIAPVKRQAVTDDLPDIATLSVVQIRNLDITPAIAKKLYDIETAGLNRSKVLAYLKVEMSKA